MQDNSFKKNREQELHGLSIEPSQKVWLAVEKELDKEKRRYFPVWWWLFFLFIGSAGLLWYTGHNGKKEEIAANEKTAPVIAQQKNTTGAAAVIVDTKDTLRSFSAAAAATGLQITAGDIAANRQAKYFTGRTAITINGQTTAEESHGSQQLLTDKAKQKTSITVPGTETNDSEEKQSSSAEDTNTVIAPPDAEKTIARATKEDKKQEPADTVPAVVTALQKKNSKQWIKEWSVAGGGSSLAFIGLSARESSSSAADPMPGTVDPVQERNEYIFRQGAYLQAGIYIGRPLSKKISWLTGLQYNFQQVNVDRKLSVDSFWLNGTGVYTSISTRLYSEKMNMHNINIPLLLKFTAGRHFDINAGMYNNILISSNQDKYAATPGNKKTYLPMLHINPSFLVKRFSAGPFLNVGLNKYVTGRNMINYGLQLKYIPKK